MLKCVKFAQKQEFLSKKIQLHAGCNNILNV